MTITLTRRQLTLLIMALLTWADEKESPELDALLKDLRDLRDQKHGPFTLTG